MANQLVIKLAAENAKLNEALGSSTREVKRLEKQVERLKKQSGGALAPLQKSLASTNGPLGRAGSGLQGLIGQFTSITSAGAGMAPQMAAVAGALAGIGVAVTVIDNGIHKLENLAAATRKLQNVTGLSAETASAWVSVADRFGISAEQLAKSLGLMDKKLAVAGTNTKAGAKAMAIFAQAGVSKAAIASKNIDTILVQVANKFKAMHGPSGAVTKTKLALDLFGRSGTTLLPILNRGGGALQALKKKMGDYGLTIKDVDQKRVKKLKEAQKDLQQFMDGFQIFLAKKVIPKISALAGMVSTVADAFRRGKRPAGQWAGVLYDVAKAFQSVASSVSQVAGAIRDVIGALQSATGGKLGTIAKELLTHFVTGGGIMKMFATGGIVNGAQMSVVGEDGPEAIIPLSQKYAGRRQQIMAQAGLAGGGHTFVVNNYGGQLDEGALAARMAWQLKTRAAF